MQFKKLLSKTIPPDTWKPQVLILMGIFTGLGLYAFYISKSWSYLSNNPTTCTNCHIMAPQYATWVHSSHRESATCNDCHVPHNNVFNKYYFKAKDGLRHATIFTLRAEPQVILIKEAGRQVVQDNCVRCHENLLASFNNKPLGHQFMNHKKSRNCWECHRETPHGRVNSISSVPYARVPLPTSVIPTWLKRNH
jgi:cytochrome c nitrite reductase small subunit